MDANYNIEELKRDAKEIAEAKGISEGLALVLLIEGINTELDKRCKGEIEGLWRNIVEPENPY